MFGKRGKFSSPYVGPNDIFQWVGKVSYKWKLPSELALVHPVFHVFMLKKFIGDLEYILPNEGNGGKYNLSYEELPIQTLSSQVKRFRNKEVISVKVFWKNNLVEGVTWEAEADMKSCYPHFFDN